MIDGVVLRTSGVAGEYNVCDTRCYILQTSAGGEIAEGVTARLEVHGQYSIGHVL